MIRGVVFDVGEVLVDETRMWSDWADRLGVPRHTFSAVFGAVIARGRDHRETFPLLVPGFDPEQLRSAGPDRLGDDDLYPDVRPTLHLLRAAGLWLGVAGNQPATFGAAVRALDLPVDLVSTSEELGAEKPDPAFFAAVERRAPYPAAELLYVGDRLDNDVRPAAARGFRTALLRRGPWAVIQQEDPDVERVPTMRIDGLGELPGRIAAVDGGG